MNGLSKFDFYPSAFLVGTAEFTNEEVRAVLRVSADDILDPLNNGSNMLVFDPYTGAGRINAFRALGFESAPAVRITAPAPETAISEGVLEIRGAATSILEPKLEKEALWSV